MPAASEKARACLLSVFLGMISCNAPGTRPVSEDRQAQFEEQKHVIEPVALTVDEVLNWRRRFADLLGKNKDAVAARYGDPEPSEGQNTLTYSGSDKTFGRGVTFGIVNSRVEMVKIFAKHGDSLDVVNVVKRASAFTFETGTYRDSTKAYFVALTHDKRNAIQFSVSDSGVEFTSVIFTAGQREK